MSSPSLPWLRRSSNAGGLTLQQTPNTFFPAAVAAALRGGKYDSAVGVLEFDQKGDIKNPVYDIYVWKDGKSYPTTK